MIFLFDCMKRSVRERCEGSHPASSSPLQEVLRVERVSRSLVTVRRDGVCVAAPLPVPCSNLCLVSSLLGNLFPCQLTISYKQLLF